MAGAAMGHTAKLAVGATSTVDTPYEFISESLTLSEQFIDTAGLRGIRGHASERVRRGSRSTAGSITFTPNAVELDTILPWAFGGTESADSFPLAETLFSKYVSIDRGAKVYLYDLVTVASVNFACSEGGPLQVTLNLMGKDETVNSAASQPSLTIDLNSGPFMWSECVVSVGGTSYQFKDFSLTVDNRLEAQFFNSETPTRFNPTDRIVSWSLRFPLGDATAIYAPALAGVACVATFTNGNRSLSFSSTKVQTPRESPTVQGRTEIMLPWTGVARRDGTTQELVTTCDSTG